MKFITIILILLNISYADTKCPQMFINGKAPISNALTITEVCFDNYVVGYSEKLKNPIYSAEHLTSSTVLEAKKIPRTNAFHQEKMNITQTKLAAYKNSGYDRGHMTPDADMPTLNSEWQSFSMLNMCPQNPDNNRHAWEHMEEQARQLALKNDVYVISGPIFKDSSKTLNDGTLIPTAFYKIIYIKNKPQPNCMYIKNEEKQQYILRPIAECESLTGLKFQ